MRNSAQTNRGNFITNKFGTMVVMGNYGELALFVEADEQNRPSLVLQESKTVKGSIGVISWGCLVNRFNAYIRVFFRLYFLTV